MDKIFFILNGIRGWRTWNCDNDLFSSIFVRGSGSEDLPQNKIWDIFV